jgi:long-chain acyl-CoA synthetase
LKECGCISGVREGYGLTECVTGSCLIPENSDKTESVGLPYADTFYKIADTESGMELQKGEIGEIILRGPTVMLGYLNEPDETAKTLKKHDDGYIWLHTGDLGYMDDDGYVYFRQRLKRMIISGGYNIYPQIIENVIENHPSVLLCAVVGIPDEIMGQKVKAYVQLTDKNPDKEQIKNELIKLMEKDISRYAQPREIVFVESLPKTLVGKIAYNELMKCKEI